MSPMFRAKGRKSYRLPFMNPQSSFLKSTSSCASGPSKGALKKGLFSNLYEFDYQDADEKSRLPKCLDFKLSPKTNNKNSASFWL